MLLRYISCQKTSHDSAIVKRCSLECQRVGELDRLQLHMSSRAGFAPYQEAWLRSSSMSGFRDSARMSSSSATGCSIVQRWLFAPRVLGSRLGVEAGFWHPSLSVLWQAAFSWLYWPGAVTKFDGLHQANVASCDHRGRFGCPACRSVVEVAHATASSIRADMHGRVQIICAWSLTRRDIQVKTYSAA